MAHNKVFKLKSPVQGCHYFRQFWTPEPEQFLNCYYERGDVMPSIDFQSKFVSLERRLQLVIYQK